MKSKFLLLLLSFILLTGISCSKDSEEDFKTENSFVEKKGLQVTNDKGEVLYISFYSDAKTPIDFSKPIVTKASSITSKPYPVNYWQCGAGVYTNGTSTYTMSIASCSSPNVYMAIDHFSETVYCFTTSWGGTCGSW